MDSQTDNQQTPQTQQNRTPPVTQPVQPNAGTGEQITLTPQALKERLARAEKAAQNKLLKELGLESIDAAKAKLGGTPSQQAAPETNTELDELRQTVEALKAESAQHKAEKEKAEQQRRDSLVNDAIKSAVKGVKYPDDVVTLIRGNRSIDLSKAWKEDGTIDTTVITAAIEEARKARPEWFAPTTPGSPSNFGGTPPPIDQKKKEAALNTQAAYIKKGF